MPVAVVILFAAGLFAFYADICRAGSPSVNAEGTATPQIYGYSSGTVGTYYLVIPTLSANDTLVGQNTTDTLTNKTLTTPTINQPKTNLYVVATTENLTLTATHNGAIITNKGASGSVTITAPSSGISAGFNVTIACMADQVLAFDPKPDTASVYVKGAAQVAGKYISVTDIGDFVQLVWDGTDWLAFTSISGADADITVEG